jgi:hypothetical protein
MTDRKVQNHTTYIVVRIADANQLRRYDNLNGSIMHAEVEADDPVIILAKCSISAVEQLC